MKLFHFVKIKNFKTFGDTVEIILDQPSVLIGPNNAGKTSVLQALALWSFGVKSWFESKGETKATKNLSSGINRLNLTQLPVQNARFLWNNTEVRKGSSELIPLEITIGLEFEGKVYDCTMSFTQQSSEIIYCLPNREFHENKDLMTHASRINVNLLYSMSGVAIEEVLIPEGRINSLIGQGQTSEVLRNLCYMIHDKPDKSDWKEMVHLMNKLFTVDLLPPKFIASRGLIELKYKTNNVKNSLDIAMAGRGLQQFLLIFSYLYSHKESVLLLDEPDAHLEILRQRTIYAILKRLTQQNGNQLIIATHSEVILEEASNTNLELILLGETIHLAEKDTVKKTLRDFGIEHYYKAKQKKSILYVESSTDIDMLKEFAKILNDEAYDILDSNLNYYYTQNSEPEDSTENEIDRNQGYFDTKYQKHFKAIKSIVPEFKGIGIFDGDGKQKRNELGGDLAIIYWQRYELENYFVKPHILLKWVDARLNISNSIFKELFAKALNDCMLEFIFNNNHQSLEEFNALSPGLKDTFWLNSTGKLKLSLFLENVFKKYSQLSGQPIPLNKGSFYELIQYLPVQEVDEEIKTVLKLIVECLTTNHYKGISQ